MYYFTLNSGSADRNGQIEGDWIVVFGLASAAEGQVSDEERAKFGEAERLITVLVPTVARMRRKCEVRVSFEAAKEKLREQLQELQPPSPLGDS